MLPLLQNHYVFFTLCIVAVFTFYLAFLALLKRDPVRARLRQVGMPEGILLPGMQEEVLSPLGMRCKTILALFGGRMAQARETLIMPLWRAGFASPDAVYFYLLFRWCVQPLFLVLTLVIGWRLIQLHNHYAPLILQALYGLIGLLNLTVGLAGAQLFVKNRALHRQRMLQQHFPDMLDLLLICVEAGLPLDAALARVCRELRDFSPELVNEMDLTRVELNVRQNRVEAIQHLVERTGTQGFRVLASVLVQSEQFGTSIAEALRVLAEEYRSSRMLQAEMRAARIPALIPIPLIFFFMIPIFMVILGPPLIRAQGQGGIVAPLKGVAVHHLP